jgi:hypothetical protein
MQVSGGGRPAARPEECEECLRNAWLSSALTQARMPSLRHGIARCGGADAGRRSEVDARDLEGVTPLKRD